MTIDTEILGGSGSSASASKRTMADVTTPSTLTPARIATPPPPSERGRLETKSTSDNSNQKSSRQLGRTNGTNRTNALDIDAIDGALLREINRQQRESTPGASPHRKRQRINGDR
jgi:cell division cycle 20-like protein 1, cofactor of APC complex